MISPQEIKSQALKWWKPFLQSHVKSEQFFPKTIDRIGKITSSSVKEKFGEFQIQLDELYKNSRQILGYGYNVNKENVNFRRTGSHSLPQSITFDTADDYIEFIGKKHEWKAFLKCSNLILYQFPKLKDWIISNPLFVIENENKWEDILKVCHCFLNNPRPDVYIRQLPIDLHTKFIEHNETVIKSLLDYLIPEHVRDVLEKQLSKRYYLRYDEPTIRIRILDSKLKIGGLKDLRMPLSDFESLKPTCSTVLFTENKMNFLALPELPLTIAIWCGGGFMINYIKNVKWFNSKKVLYWGDLDVHGFLMLHQMRSYFAHTESVLMDMETFEQFKIEGLVPGEKLNAGNLNTLTATEMEMFNYLKTNNFRLEQEKIRQEHVNEVLKVNELLERKKALAHIKQASSGEES